MNEGCHRCPHSKHMALYSEIEWRLTPCSQCPQLNEDAASFRTLAFDETRGTPENEGGEKDEGGRMKDESEVGGQADEPVLPVSVLAEAVRMLLALPLRTFRILQRRLRGDSYRLIGEELQVTPQAAEVQLRRALKAQPHLRCLLPKKEARRRKRLSKARRGKPGAGK